MSEQVFLKRLHSLSKFLKAEVDDEILSMYDRVLSPLGYDKLVDAIDRLGADLGPGSQFPSMRAIRDVVTGQAALTSPETKAKDEEAARTAAALIIQAVRRYGSINNTARVQEHVGELGWDLVKDRGGWQAVCDQLHSEDAVRNYELDLRELAKAKLSRRRRGEVGPPSLPPIGGDQSGRFAIEAGGPVVDLTPVGQGRP